MSGYDIYNKYNTARRVGRGPPRAHTYDYLLII